MSFSIERPWADVYEFLAEPLNLPTWTLAIERIEHLSGNDWLAKAPDGDFVLRYTPRNRYGILDFSISRPGKEVTHPVPLRVFANDQGAEITYTHYQRPGMSDEAFVSEAEWIKADFLTLKSLLESRS